MTDRILTTHAGSLPRTPELTRLLVARDQRRTFDVAELEEVTADAVASTVAAQLATGLDLINDGEVPRVDRAVPGRLGGERSRRVGGA